MRIKVFYCVTLALILATADDDELTDENYNVTWMYLSDGNDRPEVAYLKEPPGQNFAMLGGDTIQFELYTNKNFQQPFVVKYNGQRKIALWKNVRSNFDPTLETKILIHGWMSNTKSETIQAIKNEYFKKGSYNVIAVNWESRASDLFYTRSVRFTKEVGKAIAGMIDTLVRKKGADSKRIHLIGHSLGAHIMGYAGSYTKYRVARITGLDPARPGFEMTVGPEERLDETDAEFVDVIHSCSGVLGFSEPIGHADFYPNSGKPPQPGCGGLLRAITACSHGRSHRFFAESINSEKGFYAYPCLSWYDFDRGACNENPVLMGDKLPKITRGVFYLSTQSDTPFAMGLDPAGPVMENAKPSERLDPEDAIFVDVIHTCTSFLGIAAAIGDADFYPNGGTGIQPVFWTKSISSHTGFYALPCESWEEFEENSCVTVAVLMGDAASTSTRGVFYLKANL